MDLFRRHRLVAAVAAALCAGSSPAMGAGSVDCTHRATQSEPFQLSDVDPVWAPDGSRIAFTRYDYVAHPRGRRAAIYTIRPHGSNERRVANGRAFSAYPSWSPDGARIAFMGNTAAGPQIFVMNAAGTGVVQITNEGEGASEPAWSPDGTRIAYAAGTDVTVVNPDGTSRQVLGEGSSPEWSPDGGRIAFVRRTSFGNHIWTMRVDASDPRDVIGASASWPSWSPDGLRLAYQIYNNVFSYPELHVASAIDGSGETLVAERDSVPPYGAAVHKPAWSPDGAWLVFAADGRAVGGDVGWELRVIGSDGLGERRLTYHCLMGVLGPDVLQGTWLRDIVFGLTGNDLVYPGPGNDHAYGGGGSDRLFGGSGLDTLIGGDGNDVVRSRDGQRDVIRCGKGFDRVGADRADAVAHDCERVRRL